MTAQDKRRHAYDYMIGKWPNAHSLRFEGKCPDCKQPTLYSCQLPQDESYTDKHGGLTERCGFFCVNRSCGWGNAGSRPVENDELDGGA